MKAFLDIETSFYGEITVVGIYYPPDEVIQLVGDEVNRTSIARALDKADIVLTYNGSRFDLPVIRRRTGLDISRLWTHRDLMLDCWKCGLKGGLKRIEELLGIKRASKGVDGWMAMKLWHSWERCGDREALEKLLEYNRDDVVNLELLERKLQEIARPGSKTDE